MVDIGGLYSIGMPHAQISMTYSEGSTTTIGVAVSVPLSDSSFSLGGTFTETKSGEEGIPTQSGVEENMQTPYTFGLYSLCGGLIHQAQPEEWVTGSRGVTVIAPKAQNCSDFFSKGGTFSTTDEKAGTFTAGVDLKNDGIDVNMSAQSGYDKDTSITWTFPKGGGYLCGTNNVPPKAAWNVMDVSKFGNLEHQRFSPGKGQSIQVNRITMGGLACGWPSCWRPRAVAEAVLTLTGRSVAPARTRAGSAPPSGPARSPTTALSSFPIRADGPR